MSVFEGWPDEARALVERACERHGGWARYERVVSLRCDLVEVGGPLPRVKGLGRTHAAPSGFTVWPHERRTELHDFPGPGASGVFEDGAVRLSPDGPSSPEHRATFAGWAKNRRWQPLDALYFFGYALSTYLALPFVLAETRFVAVASAGGGLRGVDVELPPGFHTHGPRQRFFFDADGLLRRHDYVAEIVGPWAHGAHFSNDYAEVDGFPVALRRHVVAAPFGLRTPIPVLRARFARPRIDYSTPGGSSSPGSGSS